jgi:hypothetical protein
MSAGWDRPVGDTCTRVLGDGRVRIRPASSLVPGWRNIAWWDTPKQATAGASIYQALANLSTYKPSRAWARRYTLLLERLHAAEAKRRPVPIPSPGPARPTLRRLEADEWSDIDAAACKATEHAAIDSDAADDIRNELALIWLARPIDLPTVDRIKWLMAIAKNLVAMWRRKWATKRRILREARHNFREQRTGNYVEDDLIALIDAVHAFERQWAVDHPGPPLRTIDHSFLEKIRAGAMYR